MINLEEIVEKLDKLPYADKNFECIEKPLHPCPDICGFLYLEKLCPHPGQDIVRGAEHDEIFINVTRKEFEKVATEEDVLYLIRCGIRYNVTEDYFYSFV